MAGGGLATGTANGNLTMEPMLEMGGRTYCTADDLGEASGSKFTGSGAPDEKNLIFIHILTNASSSS